MESSPGCWECYGEVLAREYNNRTFFEDDCIHKLTVDTYAVQHPGRPSQQSIRSVGHHLVRLCLILNKKISPARTQDLMVEMTKKKESFWWLDPPQNMGKITILDVHCAEAPEEHKKMVLHWADSVWKSWSDHHATVKQWLPDSK